MLEVRFRFFQLCNCGETADPVVPVHAAVRDFGNNNHQRHCQVQRVVLGCICYAHFAVDDFRGRRVSVGEKFERQFQQSNCQSVRNVQRTQRHPTSTVSGSACHGQNLHFRDCSVRVQLPNQVPDTYYFAVDAIGICLRSFGDTAICDDRRVGDRNSERSRTCNLHLHDVIFVSQRR